MAVATPTIGTRPPHQRRSRGLFSEMRRHWADYVYVAPALLVMLFVIGYPIAYTIYLSFFSTPPSSANWYFNGIENYQRILGDPQLSFWESTKNTFIWTVASTFFAFVLGFGAALIVNREFPGRGIIRGLLLIPYIISQVPAAYIWRWLYNSDYGLISGTLKQLGWIERSIVFLDSRDLAMPAVIVVNVWKEFPFAMVLLLAGLQTVPSGLLRAAKIDGAGTIQTFLNVTVPHLRNVILVSTILLFVANLNSFTLIWLMTGGGPAGASQIWIIKVYTLAFQDLQYGRASAFAVILFIIMMLFGYFYVKALTGQERKEA
ncbi:MAG TPA: sugar ABC transporter permease [Thermomicrobiales bacterium]